MARQIKVAVERSKRKIQTCETCGLSLEESSGQQWKQHICPGPDEGTVRCPEAGCEFRGRQVGDLANHLQGVHRRVFTIIERNFDSDEEFLAWKYALQTLLNVSFAGKFTSKDRHFYCSRIASRSYLKKKKRSSQIFSNQPHYCTAYIKVFTAPISGKLKAQISCNHFGHDLDVEEIQGFKFGQIEPASVFGNVVQGLNLGRIIRAQDLDSRVALLHLLDTSDLMKLYNGQSLADPRETEEPIEPGSPPAFDQLKKELEAKCNVLLGMARQSDDKDALQNAIEKVESSISTYVSRHPIQVTQPKQPATPKKRNLKSSVRVDTENPIQINKQSILMEIMGSEFGVKSEQLIPLTELQLNFLCLVVQEKILRSLLIWLQSGRTFRIPGSSLLQAKEVLSSRQLLAYRTNGVKSVEDFMTNEAMKEIGKLFEALVKQWSCGACKMATAEGDMVFCLGCEQWFHYDCVDMNGKWMDINCRNFDWKCPACR